ncbi:betaine--homocysteine S-methyltransferase [Oceanicella actignis]|uniref:5-methyltetrahydrofolate--homocysteine methyltransferase n=1 Tax=Oceanicella actignis TaxID=1189325 RepID=A0A1M7SGV5_9RHOB|nr:betaine--homocysteine S-methyltransferase [Oceanicella actignis]TYO91253.1 5-methyltetrahydrofolate--homocysteine methyltransferase [Oceanicella actignis]SET20706.1 5-methyltetrahydrofolate--homocysteine methyltransferase [Oceanicella actignis]SHN57687.1 5-methyltetrahydrofolate--homocysteine methyltransferase [Oceanicella actignis]
MSDLFRRLLSEREWLLADGATGTNLFARGLNHGDAPEGWNLAEPDKVRAHYRDFIEAGSDIVLTNSFGGTANRLKLHGLDDRVFEVNRAAAALLRAEIDAARAATGREIVCAGDVGPTGDLFAEVGGVLTPETARAAFRAQIEGLKAGGADVIWIETMSSAEELTAALEAAAEAGMPAISTMSFDTNGRTMMGVTPAGLARLAHSCAHPPAAFGGNCGTGAPDLLIGLLSVVSQLGDEDVLVAKANCGIPEYVDGAIRYSGTEELMADYACLARDLGARVIGGCCGTTPAHVRAMREALETRPRGPRPTAEEIVARLGPASAAAMELLQEGGGERPAEAERRGRRGRRAGREARGPEAAN